MAYKISEECISCGACAGVCPVAAISEGSTQYEISAYLTGGPVPMRDIKSE